MSELVLASGSPRRNELLASARVEFTVCRSGVEETPPEPRESPADYAVRLAVEKVQAVASSRPAALVIGADTVIDFEGLILGKPGDEEDARRMLASMAGRQHQVLTGLSLMGPETGIETAVVSTTVLMVAATTEQIAAYVATGEPLDKAGSYGIQGLGGKLVAGIEGCYNNVVGLPLCELGRLLAGAGERGVGVVPCRLPNGDACPRLGAWPER